MHVAMCQNLATKMVYGPSSLISGRLIVDVEAPGPNRQEDVSRARQFLVEENLGAHMPTPPFERRLDIARKQMSMMEIERHCRSSLDCAET
jgi:hypothetical protein